MHKQKALVMLKCHIESAFANHSNKLNHLLQQMYTNYEQELLTKCREAILVKEVPVAALATYSGKIISIHHNLTITNCNQTSHAEMLVLQDLFRHFNVSHFFQNEITIHVTLEPCCMCLAAISMSRIKNIVYWLEDEKFGGISRIFINKSSYFKPDMYYTYNEKYHTMIQNFFQDLRK